MDQLLAIRAFARVVEAGTFTKAADSLGMPNATLTKLIQGLEAHLRVKLLQRTTRRVSVTAEGALYYEKTQRLLCELHDADTGFSVSQGRPRGRLRIDAGGSFATVILIPALPDFFARYPEIQVDLGISDRHADIVGDNVDCAIRGGVLTDMAMVGRQIGAAGWVTCATPGYLARHGVPADPDALADNHVVASYLSAATKRVVPMRFISGGRTVEINGARTLGVNESNAHLAAGLAGLGIIQTFGYAVREHVRSGALVPILEQWQPAPHPFHVVYPPNRHLSNRVRVFIDWIAAEFATLAN